MPRAPKKCAEWVCDERVVGRTYCAEHVRRSPSSLSARDPGEQRRRKAAVDAWVAEHGWVCSGWGRAPHPSRDLTAAHSVPVALGGGGSGLGVLCRSCNSHQAMASFSVPDLGGPLLR